MGRKQKLIEALKQERVMLQKANYDTSEHDIAIEFLETGKTDKDPKYYELLDAIMNDFETLCDDYKC